MTGPSSVLIGAVTYSIEYVEHEDMPEPGCVGFTAEGNAAIFVSLATSEATIRATVWHECLHAVVNEYGRGRQVALKAYLAAGNHEPSEIEELFVGALEAGVMCFVRDNPNAWDWINGLLDDWEEDE